MQGSEILELANLRIDGRKYNELRSIRYKLTPSVGSSIDGSVYYEQGLNKVLVHVHGPQEAQRNENIVSDKAVIKVNVLNSSFSGIERKKRRANGDRRTNEMERVIKDIYSGNILLDLYPRSEIVIIVHILEVDGSILSTIINAISMALMDAGVMMKDIITACNVGVMRSNICVDLTNMEEIHCSSSLFIAIKSRSNVNNIVYMNLDKKINPEQLQVCLDEATANCLLIRGQIEKGMKENMQELKSKLL